MKRIVNIVIAWVLGQIVSLAAPVTPEAAAEIAGRWAASVNMRNSAPERCPLHSRTIGRQAADEQQAPLYVFNIGTNDGYVIVSGDDRTRSEVLGYSTTGHFDWDQLCETERWWLQGYIEEIETADADRIQTAALTEERQKTQTALAKAVTPLCNLRWKQRSPFNDNCPVVNDTVCLAGCVAISWGMCARYLGCPTAVNTTYSYTWEKQGVTRSGTVNSTYNHSLLLPYYDSSSSTAAKKEAAKFIGDIANCVHMNYGTTGSGANSDFAAGVMVQDFGFDKGLTYHYRKYYADEDWDSMLRQELDAGRIIQYSGWKESGGGHAFICDGYNEKGYFHFNWGWGSIPTVYYKSNALADGYDNKQQCATRIQRAQSGSEIGVDATYNADLSAKVSTLNAITFELNAGPRFAIHTPCTVYHAVCLENISTRTKYYTAEKNIKCSTKGDWGYTNITTYSYSYAMTKSLPNGTYVCYPVYRVGNSSNWQPFYFPSSYISRIKMVVTSGVRKVDNSVLVRRVSFAKDQVQLYEGESLTLSASVVPTDATNGTLVYTSSNPAVATVDASGKVKALTLGTTVITATTQDGSLLEASYTVNVVPLAEGETIVLGDMTYEVVNADSLWLRVIRIACSEEVFIPETIARGQTVYTVREIDSYILYNCTQLKTLSIPSTIRTIEVGAFYMCTGLQTLYLYPTAPPTLGKNVLAGNLGKDTVLVEFECPYVAQQYQKQGQPWNGYKNLQYRREECPEIGIPDTPPATNLSEIEHRESLIENRKYLLNGRLYIRRHDEWYNAQGQRVR